MRASPGTAAGARRPCPYGYIAELPAIGAVSQADARAVPALAARLKGVLRALPR